MFSNRSPETAVSAPGKVLLTGGYLVLDRKYTGLVFTLNARIHVIVRQLPKKRRENGGTAREDGIKAADQTNHEHGVEKNAPLAGDNLDDEMRPKATDQPDQNEEDEEAEIVVVKSPQFVDAVWEYNVQRIDNGGGVKVVQTNDVHRNKFVETSLNYALTYISYVAGCKKFGSLAVTILADNEYYSETATSVASQRGPFAKFGVPLHEAHKTGLGSSAALVTALVSSIVVHRTVHHDELPSIRTKLHNLAQAAHCAAQGKIGSGFDVAGAVYGSCVYRRFSPEVLGKLGEPGSDGFEERLFAVVEDLNSDFPWDAEIMDAGLQLPRGLRLVLCDVDCGSETPGMVKKVLEWREKNPQEAEVTWTALQRNNDKFRMELKRISLENDDVYGENEDYNVIRNLLFRSRLWIRAMTKKSGVPIEPKAQTDLLDTLCELDGVVGGVVPGAGGYDAVALLIRDELGARGRREPLVLESLRGFLENWKSTTEDDFGGKIGEVKLLDVRQDSDGVMYEVAAQYDRWLE